MPHAAGNHLHPSLYLVPVQVHKQPAVRQMVRWNRPEQIAVVVVFVVPVHCALVQPAEVVDHLRHQLVALVHLVEDLAHRAGGVDGVLQSGFQDVEERGWTGLHVGHPPLVPVVHFVLDPVLVEFVDVVEVSLPVPVVYVGDWLILSFVGAG